jgi:hypothetical protein
MARSGASRCAARARMHWASCQARGCCSVGSSGRSWGGLLVTRRCLSARSRIRFGPSFSGCRAAFAEGSRPGKRQKQKPGTPGTGAQVPRRDTGRTERTSREKEESARWSGPRAAGSRSPKRVRVRRARTGDTPHPIAARPADPRECTRPGDGAARAPPGVRASWPRPASRSKPTCPLARQQVATRDGSSTGVARLLSICAARAPPRRSTGPTASGVLCGLSVGRKAGRLADDLARVAQSLDSGELGAVAWVTFAVSSGEVMTPLRASRPWSSGVPQRFRAAARAVDERRWPHVTWSRVMLVHATADAERAGSVALRTQRATIREAQARLSGRDVEGVGAPRSSADAGLGADSVWARAIIRTR